jgi:cholera toxin transcriptional activator
MASPQNNSRIARFGVFEINFDAAELRKSGAKIRLQGQPFQVLAVLVERAGQIVTREDLRQTLWASDTFVDFDHSLNTAVNKVRETLGDSASSPRYVETIARRGYRFIAPVEFVASAEETKAPVPPVHNAAAIPERDNVNLAANIPVRVLHPELHVPLPHRGVTRGLFGLTQIMYLSFYLAALFHLRGIENIADSSLSSWGAEVLIIAVMVTAGIGIPLRLYLTSAVGFDYQQLGERFRQMFPFVLALDELWAIAPFLLIDKIGVGAAFAVCAALLYLPFSERTLIRMAYVTPRQGLSS